MDPNTTLAELREAVIQLGRLNTPDAPDDVYHATNAVIERWSALDTWISNGGFFPSQWLEAQRRALESTRTSGAVAPPAQRNRCTPKFHDPLAETLELLEPDPWDQRGAYDDPAVQRAIAEHTRGPYFAGGLTAAEVLGSVRSDD
jgi:hypothetical protein